MRRVCRSQARWQPCRSRHSTPHLLGFDVVADGMAARRKAGPSAVAYYPQDKRATTNPPHSAQNSGFHTLLTIVPLRAEREVVVADFFSKVTLFPDAAVDECHLLFLERRDLVRR